MDENAVSGDLQMSMDRHALDRLQERLGVSFQDLARLERALTHRSATVDQPLESNERLEFLGDAVVGLAVSEELFRRFPSYSEGELAKSKAYIVSETALADAALAVGLDEFVVMSPGEATTGGRRRRSILADAFEAVIAAIYLDCGIAQARQTVSSLLAAAVQTAATERHRRDYKSALQEHTQALERITPIYHILRESGHEHDKTFTAQVMLAGEVIGEGEGKSKKEAEQAAAQNALGRIAAVPVSA